MSDFSNELLAAIPMPLILIGPDQRIAAMNPGAGEVFPGMGPGGHYLTVLRQPALSALVEQCLNSGEGGTARYVDRAMMREASYRVGAAAVMRDGARSVLLSFEDVSDVEWAGEMRRDFVANVSHELKTPLTALLGFIETLRGPARDDAQARERFLAIMEREAGRMNRLVADLLVLSRVESAERQRPTGRVNIEELVKTVLLSLQVLARSEEVSLTMSRRDDGSGPLTVQGDHDQLQQVLTNLIENGIKYGRKGGNLRVDLERFDRLPALRGPGVRISVEDDGDGFDPIHIPRLTERFYRIDNHRSRTMGGTGLGLAIAKHIVNRHRGRLRIKTEPGRGSTFTVLLPAPS
ncbi:MAG: sensor histidine kinase [Tropicimonas sp.]|uniref:sensor histidine kinase n=1 Tax=Tropicimonas sp. TaxID=2067044 RepID=UPI003A86F541